MKNWFNIKLITDPKQRTMGVIVRFLGIDGTAMLLGWIDDWKLIDFRIPVNYGIYFQFLGILLAVGRLPTNTFRDTTND